MYNKKSQTTTAKYFQKKRPNSGHWKHKATKSDLDQSFAEEYLNYFLEDRQQARVVDADAPFQEWHNVSHLSN